MNFIFFVAFMIGSLRLIKEYREFCEFKHMVTAHAQTVDTGLGPVTVTTIPDTSVPVATAGDAGFLTTHRDITDIYNVCVLIAIELMFWVFWNVIRTVYRVLNERGKF